MIGALILWFKVGSLGRTMWRPGSALDGSSGTPEGGGVRTISDFSDSDSSEIPISLNEGIYLKLYRGLHIMDISLLRGIGISGALCV